MHLILFLGFLFGVSLRADPILTSNVYMGDHPDWVDERRVEKAVSKVQGLLEWDIRRVTVHWYTDQAAFQRAHGGGEWVVAFFRREDSTVHLGPRVTTKDFDGVFGHELVHVILFQKYKRAIPDWLEEGLANFTAEKEKVDYTWLAAQPFQDVTTLGHPFGKHLVDPHYHYIASQAVAEMVNAKCNLRDLLQMSVERKFETYLAQLCELTDVNAAFRDWVTKQAKRAAPRAIAKKAKPAAKP